MSINFRTRSQTIVNYSSYIQNNEVTGCCYVYASNTNTTDRYDDYTLSQCNQENGYFMVGACDENNTITPSSIGCCCGCALKTPETNRFLKNTTLCECESIGGKWTLNVDCSSSLPTEQENTLCKNGTLEQSNVIDFREKKACCHPEIQQDGTISAECTDVCNEKECADKTIFPYVSTFYNNGRKCNESVGASIPVSLECQLNETNLNVLNSCDNGTNLFCWISGQGTSARCSLKEGFYDKYFAGKYLNKITHYVATIQRLDYSSGEESYLIPGFFWPETTVPTLSDFAKSGNIKLKKVCPGSLSFTNDIEEPQRYYDGYFAGITENNTVAFYTSSGYFSNFENPSYESPVTTVVGTALDLIATRTFSAWLSTTFSSQGNLKIQGRFYNPETEQYKTYSPNLTLKKLYQHNTSPSGFNFYNGDYSTIGFVGQKLDNTFDYYSPFIDELTELQDIRNMIRSLPAKEYVTASFGVNTFCGIEQDGTLNCVSLNDELTNSYNRSKKYKLVSCSNTSTTNTDPSTDYCFAVDFENKFEKLGSVPDFNNQPAYSITDVTSISCVRNSCQATVVPDIDICNNQIQGSCCSCVDIGNCIQTTQGNCNTLDGVFRAGGVCCSENDSLETCEDCTSLNCERNTPLRSVQIESTLPTDELTYYQDGLYVGIFEPGSPLNSEGSTINGRPFTGSAVNYKPNVVGYGTIMKKWAIIVAPFDFELEPIKTKREQLEIIPASLYDGLWNTYGDSEIYYGIQSKSMETLRNKSKFSGWYLPSKNELEFINLKINHGFFIPEIFKSLNSAIYLTSTPFFRVNADNTYNIEQQIFNNQAFMYGQSFKKSDYGSIYLVPRTDKVNVRLIRRIELE